MKTELKHKLIEQYPWLFRNPADNTYGYKDFSMLVHDGWYPLLERLCENLAEICISKDGFIKNFNFYKIISEYGRLYIYSNNSSAATHLLVRDAESEARTTCEGCSSKEKVEWVWLKHKSLCVKCRVPKNVIMIEM